MRKVFSRETRKRPPALAPVEGGGGRKKNRGGLRIPFEYNAPTSSSAFKKFNQKLITPTVRRENLILIRLVLN